ncbi:calmodulin-binding transcription activator 3-like [Quercus robur]|uniref:calmodulin-binding transcription activator 3-like n=1 Tax=Quercus robur TaxID=38942 RepID=UPI002162AB3A|nr:calmodulin-binding transcription activator 3-like [Quercus robur]
MAKGRHSGLGNPLINANQIVTEAQKRWLRTAEICGIIQNYKNFRLAAEPAKKPPSGSFFLFNRKELRCFRKDGYNWTKKRDGKTVMEAHEKLKVGGIEVLNCYYARGEENKNLQRRSYWLLQGELSHVVLVHYREVKGNRTNDSCIKETEEAFPYFQETEPNSEMDGYVSSCFHPNNSQVTSQTIDITGLNSAQALEHMDTESACNHQASSGFHLSFEFQQPMVEKMNPGLSDPFLPASIPNYCQGEFSTVLGVGFGSLAQADKAKYSNNMRQILDSPPSDDDLGNGTSGNQAVPFWPSFPETQPDTNGFLLERENLVLRQHFTSNFVERWEFSSHPQIQNEWQTSEGKWPLNQNVHAESEYGATSLFHEQDVNLDEQFNFQESCLLQTDNQEIHPMQNNLQVQLSDADHGCKTALEGKIDFAILNQWMMSDEVECLFKHNKYAVTTDNYSGKASGIFLLRFEKLLSLTSVCPPSADFISVSKKSEVRSKISSLLEGEDEERDQMLNVIINQKKEWHQILELASEKDFSSKKVQEKLLKKLLKEKLHVWLLQKEAEDGKGPSVLDEGGQGVLHLAASLGYDWALEPTIIAGVSVNFRDVNGWTALHWAAFCGRERTVAFLVSLGADPAALVDPCSKDPSGRTAADLASANGHKGIAGYLAESHLNSHLSSLTLETGEGNAAGISGAKAVETVSERSATPVSDGDLPYSLKDSLAAVCNASQAFARIHEDYRVKSFQKKQLKEYGDDKFGMSDAQALSLLALRTNKSGKHDLPVHAAAIRIQSKFRSWKGRREFLKIKQRMVEIQAQARQHQVRKNYIKIIWSVGIVEKVILRWKRKGGGLRGFKAEALAEGHKMQDKSSEDDYDFLKEGRKQTEERLQKAHATVKSMAQSAEARDQYLRLLNVLTNIQGSMVVGDGVPSSSDEMADYNDLIDIEAFLDEDTNMPSA